MNIKEELTKRLSDAIRSYADAPILIGPNWLQEGPKKGKVNFQYQGGPKVAKALGRNTDRVVRGLLKCLDLSGLSFEARIGKDGIIHIFEKKERNSSDSKADES